MKRFAIHYGDEYGYTSLLGELGAVSATSLEEAAEKLGIELVPGTRCIVPNDALVRVIEEVCQGYPLPEGVMESLVLVEKE